MTATDSSTPAHRLVRPVPPYEPCDQATPALFELPLLPAPRAAQPVLTPSPPTLQEAAARTGAHLILRLLIEVLDGRRPVAQLAEAVTGPVLRYAGAASRAMRDGRPATRHVAAARLRSIRLTQPTDGVAEVCAVCQLRGRIRAVAARFEQRDDGAPLGWRCTALRLG